MRIQIRERIRKSYTEPRGIYSEWLIFTKHSWWRAWEREYPEFDSLEEATAFATRLKNPKVIDV